jgi:NADH-quinone oxidoreductase subunit C
MSADLKNIPVKLEENISKLVGKFPAVEVDSGKMKNCTCLLVNPENLSDVAKTLADWVDYPMNYLNCITAVDHLTHIEIVYFLTSIPSGVEIAVATRCPRKDGSIASVVDIWATAEYQEREVYEFFGVKFEKHPDLRRLLTPDAYKGFPLLKDYPKCGDPDDLEAVNAFLPDGWLEKAKAEKERLSQWLEGEIAKKTGSTGTPGKTG